MRQKLIDLWGPHTEDTADTQLNYFSNESPADPTHPTDDGEIGPVPLASDLGVLGNDLHSKKIELEDI
jgi:hypothetical protein